LMIWSGLLIYWAYDIYSIGPLHFFPKWVYAGLGIDHRLADGMALHFFIMWLFVINGLLYIGYTVLSGEWRWLLPRSRTVFADAWAVVVHDLGLSSKQPGYEKYNAAQQLSYTAIVIMGAASVLTGLAIYKPAQLAWLAACFGGYEGARLVHFYLTLGYLVFFVVHVLQVIRAGWPNFRGMIAGYEPARAQDPAHAPDALQAHE
ncbi:MAG: cytochrome b/b6 domain-containing protein, partial [Acidobacteriaceae bacterium]|nr:cytochrome b/b6 domain-containing protein [Acidobacteriaceae bacterium]